MTVRIVEGIRLTHTGKGWAAPNDRFVFQKWETGWVVADYGGGAIAHHPLVSHGCGWATLALAVREAKELIVLEGPLNSEVTS
jgi:hypothetical protein